VSTPDDQGATARSIGIASGIGPPPPTPGSARSTISELAGMPRDTDESWIEGPMRWDRAMGPPTFRLELHGDAPCRVELAVDSTFEQCVTSEWIQPGRVAGSPRLPFQAYTVPLDVWPKLRGAAKLHYRLAPSQDHPAAYAFVADVLDRVLTPSATAVIVRLLPS
jgi:hypothetical protein